MVCVPKIYWDFERTLNKLCCSAKMICSFPVKTAISSTEYKKLHINNLSHVREKGYALVSS